MGKVENALKQKGIEKAEQSKIKKLDDAAKLEFEDAVPMEKLTGQQASNECLSNKNQIAIIGFWKKDHKEEFYCYNYFYVPNPCEREYARSERKNYIENTE